MAEVLSEDEKTVGEDVTCGKRIRDEMSDGSDSDVPVKKKRAATRRRARPVVINSKSVCSIYKISDDLSHYKPPIQLGMMELIDSDEEEDSDTNLSRKNKEKKKKKRKDMMSIVLSSNENSEEELEFIGVTTDKRKQSHDISTDSPSPPPSPPTFPRFMEQPVRNRKDMNVIKNVNAALDQYTNAFQSPFSGADDSFTLASPNVEDKIIKVKVKCKCGLQRYDLKMTDSFAIVMKALADLFHVPIERIDLTLRNDSIIATDTPRSVNLHIADFIECVVLEPGALFQNSPLNQNDNIDIKVQGKGAKTKKTISIKKTSHLVKLMDDYAKLIDTPRNKIAFYFDGDKISPNQTPADIDIESDDVIDAVII